MKTVYKIKTVILEENSFIRSKLNSVFYKDNRFEIIAILDNYSQLEAIMRKQKPELLLLNGNTCTQELDVLKEEILKKYENVRIDSLYRVLEERYCRSIVDFSSFYKRIVEEQLIMDSKKSYDLFEDPEYDKSRKEVYRRRYFSRITDLLLLIGVPASLIGYKFIRDAILLALERPKLLSGITKCIYPEIAKKYRTSVSCVERSIRHAINLTWSRGRVYKINELYNIEILDENTKPTNGELIYIIADKVKLEMLFDL